MQIDKRRAALQYQNKVNNAQGHFGHILSPESGFHVPPYGPRHEKEFVADSGAYGGNRAAGGVTFQRVPLFLCQNVPLHAVCRRVLCFKDD